MALTDLTRISTSGIATGTSLSGAILHGDAHFRGTQVGVTSALFDSSDDALEFNDNVKLKFGNDSGFQISHTGSSSLIKQETSGKGLFIHNTGDLVKVTGNNRVELFDNLIRLRSRDASQMFLVANVNSSVDLYHDNDLRFSTTGYGATVFGNLTATYFSGPISNPSGISTFYDVRVTNNLTVEGTTTTLDTNLIGVDRIEVGANSNSVVGVAITQSGTADIVNLFDGTTEVLTVTDGGSVGIGTDNPATLLHLSSSNPIIRLTDTDNNGYSAIGGEGGNLYLYTNSTGRDFIFRGTGEVARLTGDGKLGIGTDDPSEILTVHTASGNTKQVLSSHAGFSELDFTTASTLRADIFANSSEFTFTTRTAIPMVFRTNGANERLRITSDGYIKVKGDQGNSDYWGKIYNRSDGFSFHAADGSVQRNITFYSGAATSTERLRIDSNGLMGLGVSPTSHNNTTAFQIYDDYNSQGYPRIRLTNQSSGTASSDGYEIVLNGSDLDAVHRLRENADIYFMTNNLERVRIFSNGNVGVGDYSSANLTHAFQALRTSGSTYVSSKNTGGNALFYAEASNGNTAKLELMQAGVGNFTLEVGSTNALMFKDDGTERLRIDSSGRVLIGNSSTNAQEIGDGTLQIFTSDRKHPAIKVNAGNANGFTMLADTYKADESQVNIGLSYSSSKFVLSTSVKPSDTADNVYLSSQDTFAAKPCAFAMNHQGLIQFLNTNTSATTTTDSPVTLYERFRITQHGTTQVNSICPRIFSPNTGSTNGNYWKIGSVTLNGSEGFILTFCGTGGYSSGSQIAASTKVTARCSNGSTLVGYMTGESHGAACGIDDVRWKHEGTNVFSIWAKVQHYAQITPFVDLFGDYTNTNGKGGWQPDNTNTGSTSAPSGSTAFDKYAYKQIGGVNTIQYTANDTLFLQNIRMANDKGIDFSAETNEGSSSQNTLLADYEEGTWTPTNTVGMTLTVNNTAHYIKVGKQVTVWFDVTLTGHPDSAQCSVIQNLPYISKATNSYYGQSNSVWYSNTGDAKRDYDDDNTLIFVTNDSTTINIWNVTSGHVRVRSWANGRRFRGTVTYIAKN